MIGWVCDRQTGMVVVSVEMMKVVAAVSKMVEIDYIGLMMMARLVLVVANREWVDYEGKDMILLY